MDKIDVSKVAPIFAKQGWSVERLRLGNTRWAAASKQFDSAGGARTAIVYLQTQEDGLYLHGTYESAGEDVLAGHLRLLAPQQVSALDAILPAYLEETERRIEASWGRRMLRAS